MKDQFTVVVGDLIDVIERSTSHKINKDVSDLNSTVIKLIQFTFIKYSIQQQHNTQFSGAHIQAPENS